MHPNRFGWGLSLGHLAHGSFGMFTYCDKDPHYVLGYCLIYMPILSGHVLWYLGLTLGCLVYKVLRFNAISLLYSLQEKILNKLANT